MRSTCNKFGAINTKSLTLQQKSTSYGGFLRISSVFPPMPIPPRCTQVEPGEVKKGAPGRCIGQPRGGECEPKPSTAFPDRARTLHLAASGGTAFPHTPLLGGPAALHTSRFPSSARLLPSNSGQRIKHAQLNHYVLPSFTTLHTR